MNIRKWLVPGLCLAGVGAVWAFATGRLPNLAWLVVLACPLMHVLMMGGHGRDHAARDNRREDGDPR